MNKTSAYKMTIIVPVYNEEDNIDALNQRLGDYLKSSACKSCVLFVNDGSRDNSLAYIKEVCRHNPDFYYISLGKNSGLSAALKAGIDEACSEYVGYIDADLQTDPDDFDLLLAQIHDHALVTGIRANRKDTAFKRLQSRIANGFRRMMTDDGAADTGCPLKVMRTDYAKRIPLLQGSAPIPARHDTAAGWHLRTGGSKTLSPYGWCVQVSSCQPSRGALYRLLCLPLDAQQVYQLYYSPEQRRRQRLRCSRV